MKKIHNSFIVVMIIISLFFPSVVIGNNINNNNNLDVSKKVWDGFNWVESVNADIGDFVLFNITITYHNTDHPNASYLRKIKVIDYLPDGLEFTTGQPQPHEISGNMIIWNFTDSSSYWLYDGQSMFIEFYSKVIDDGVNINTVEVTGREFCSGIWLNGSDQATVNPCVTNPGINLTKKVYVDGGWGKNANMYVGDNVTFKIIVENTGDIDLTNVLIVDDLPGFLTYNYDSTPIHSTASDHHIEWDIGILPVGLTTEIIFSAHADMEGCGCNIANVTTNEGVTDEGDACVQAEIILLPDIEIIKQVWDGIYWTENTTVNIGDNVTFKIIIENTGDINLTHIFISDYLPNFLNYNSDANITPSNISGNQITWAIDTLNISESIEIIFSAEALYLDSGCNIVEVFTKEGVNDEDEACITVTGMNVTKEIWNQDTQVWVDEINASVGDTIQFRITIQYVGESIYSLSQIKVKDILPECLEYANNANPPETNISTNGKIIWWNLSDVLQSGDTINITFYTIITETSGCGPCINWANVTAKKCSGVIFYGNDSAVVNADCPLIADIGGPYFGRQREMITINGSALGGTPPYIFSWDLDDDGLYDDAIGDSIKRSWSSPGTYIISLKVQGSKGRLDSEDTTVTISQDNNPPTNPLTPSGPDSGESGETYEFYTSALDPNDDNIRYGWDWDGNGNIDEWTNFYESGSIAKISHTWSSAGTYFIIVKAEDIHGALSQFSEYKRVVIHGNSAPNKPFISGPPSGKIDTSHIYSSITIDINGDQIYYLFDWGDGTNSGWKGPYNSGTPTSESHIWNSTGSFTVKVKAKDINDIESAWSDPLVVSMPHTYNPIQLFLERLIFRFPILEPILLKYL